MTKHTILATLLCIFAAIPVSAKVYSLTSPDKTIKVDVNVGSDITYSVSREGNIALENCTIAMETSNGTLGTSPVLKSVKRNEHKGVYTPYNAYRNKEVADNYNAMTLNFKGGWSLEFRAYDNGAAYRFATTSKGRQTISNETIEYRMPQDAELCLSPVEKFTTMHEEPYHFQKVEKMNEITYG